MMNRRAFIGGLAAGTLTFSPAAHAQPPRRLPRIGMLPFRAPTTSPSTLAGPRPQNPYINALLLGLRELGLVYGEHYVTEPRSSDRPEHWPRLAAELVRLPVEVIVAPGPTLAALKQATSTIPIVMLGATDPVGEGFVQSLGQPGGNFTGMSLQVVETTGKRLELLKEMVPGAAPVAILWDRSAHRAWGAAEAAARDRGWKLLSLEIRDASEIDGAFRAAIEARASAIFVAGGALPFQLTRRIADLAVSMRLPTMYPLRSYVEAGGLMAYGPDLIEVWRHGAVFVAKILRGARPADLPVEQPTKFELVINLKTAKALGLTIPSSLLARADQVIE
jgi:ABC-type uncharacterized transport system substrate-binding protein